jgi:hypothetical protein
LGNRHSELDCLKNTTLAGIVRPNKQVDAFQRQSYLLDGFESLNRDLGYHVDSPLNAACKVASGGLAMLRPSNDG